jgi:hypothetical protein
MDRSFNEAEMAEIQRMFDFMRVGADRRAQIIDAANYVLARGGTATVSLFGWCIDPNPGDYITMRCSIDVFVGTKWRPEERGFSTNRSMRDVESLIVTLTLGDTKGSAVPNQEDVDTMVQFGFRAAKIIMPPYSWSSEPPFLRARLAIGRSKAHTEKYGSTYRRGQVTELDEPSAKQRRAVKAPSKEQPNKRPAKPEPVALVAVSEVAPVRAPDVRSELARIATWPNVRGAVPKVSTAAAMGMLRGPVALPMGSVAGAAGKPAKKAKRSTNTGPEADCARMLAAKRWGKPWPPSKPANDAPPTREPEVIEAEFIEDAPTVHPSWLFRDFTGRMVERAVLLMGETLLDDPFRDRVGARKVERHSLDDTRARLSLWIGRKHLMLRSRVHEGRHLVSVSLLDEGNEVARRDVFYTLDRAKASVVDDVVKAVQSLATPPPAKAKRAKAKPATSSEIARITTWAPINASAPRMQTGVALAMLSQPARALPMGSIAVAAAIEPEPLGLEDVDLVVTHTLEEGTTITGNTRPWAEAIKGLGMAFKWFAPKRLWYRQQSRGRAAPTVPLERVAEGLRKRGATVRIELPEVIDDVEANEFRADLLREKSARLGQRAEKKERAAEAKHAAVRGIAEHIPFGQPILVGHHSEKRARRDADRIINLTGQGIALHREAEQLARRARTTEARAEDALAYAEIARNRESIETFIEQLGALLKKGLKAQVKATSVQLFANNKGDVTWYVGFDGAVIPIFMEPVVLVKATRAIRVADRTQIDAGSLSVEAAYIEVRNALARLKRVAIDPTMPAPDLRPSQKGSSARNADEQAMIEGITRAMSSPAARIAMNVAYGKRTIRGKDRYRWTLQGGGSGITIIEVIVDLQREGDGWVAQVERMDQPGITDRIAIDASTEPRAVMDKIIRAVKTAMMRSGRALRDQIRAIEREELPAYVTDPIEELPKLTEAQWEVRRRNTNVVLWIEDAQRWARVANSDDARWVNEWIELVGRLPSLLVRRRFADFDAFLGALVTEWNDPARSERRSRDVENARRMR